MFDLILDSVEDFHTVEVRRLHRIFCGLRLYKKNELNFSLVWIVSYVVLFSVADSFSASLGTEKIIAAPVAIVFTLLLLVFVSKHNLKEKYGLCSFNGSLRNFLYFTPLLLIMSINLWNGVTMKLSVLETVLYILSMLCVGFIEEIILVDCKIKLDT